MREPDIDKVLSAAERSKHKPLLMALSNKVEYGVAALKKTNLSNRRKSITF